MRDKLRAILLSRPVITAAGLFVLYLVLGFFALPAIVKWQVEKQVPEKLGHPISVGEVRFDPLAFRFEVGDLVLSDPAGSPMLGFRRLVVDFEVRSVIDRAWTFAEATLEAPLVRFELHEDGRHSFSAMLERLADDAPEQEEAGELARFVVGRVALTEGRIEFADRMLDEPLVTLIEPLAVEIDALSSLPGQTAAYRVSLRSAAGERLETSGELALDPLVSKGRLDLSGLKVATLVRGMSRLLALDAPAGEIDFAATFNLGLDASGEMSGGAQDVEFELVGLSVNAAGASAPIVAFETLALKQGRVDLDARDVGFAEFRLAKGSLAAAIDEQGRLDWATLVRATPISGEESTAAAAQRLAAVSPAGDAGANEPSAKEAIVAEPAAQSSAAEPAPAGSTMVGPSAAEPVPAEPARSERPVGTTQMPAQGEDGASPPGSWRISVAKAEISDIALGFADAAGGGSAKLASVGLAMSPSAEFGVAGTRVALEQPKLSIAGARFEKGPDSFELPAGSVEAGSVSIVAHEQGFELRLDAPRLAAAEGISARAGDAALALANVLLQTGGIAVDGVGGTVSGAVDEPEITLAGVSASAAGGGAKLREVVLGGARLELRSGPEGLDLDLDALHSTLADLQLQSGEQAIELGKATIGGTKLALGQAEVGLRVEAQSPAVAMSGFAARRADERAVLDALTLEGGSIALSTAEGGTLDLTLVRPRVAATRLAMTRGNDGIDLAAATLGSGKVSLAQSPAQLRVAGSAAALSLSALAARQGADRIALQEASLELGALAVTAGGGAGAAAGTDVRIDDARLRIASVDVVGQGASSEIGRLAEASVGAKSLALALPEGPADLTGEGLSAAFSDVVVSSPADATQLLRLGSASLAGGALSLKDKRVTAERIVLAAGEAKTWLDEDGQFNWVRAFAGGEAAADAVAVTLADAGLAPSPAAPPSATRTPAASPTETPTETPAQSTVETPMETPAAAPPAGDAADPGWRIAVATAELDGFSVGFEDRRKSPVFAVALEAMRARAAAVDIGASTPMQVEIEAQLASGGQIEASGAVRVDNGASDLKLRIADIDLAPVQTYLSDFAMLELASGVVSTAGRLRYGDPEGAGALLAYEGSFAVDRLLLEEIEPRRPFFAWDAVASDDVVLTLEPNRLDIGELRIERPVGRLIIAEDQTVNLTDVLKKPAQGEEAPDEAKDIPADPEGDAVAEDAPAGDPFPVTIARIGVDDGQLEFADLSLRPQFGTRMHELKGVVTGLGTDPNQSAEVQLDARVDEYGSAKISGRISVLEPERFTQIDMAFRNLEMTSLSPYVVKFAGYRIAGGRLALDLQYRVEESKLLGQNKVVLTQMELGEKVDSPDALDLPLELAIAILKDAKGVIDIGVPVTGDLDNPEFGIGEVIGKAIGNLLGGIVTAPFRALGALFGAGDKPLDTIAFEPGRDTLAPPDREKLAAVARALNERPQLKLVVPPVYASAQDTPALKLLAVRADIVGRMGVELKPGEKPGPIDIANPRVQKAVEAAFSQRYSAATLAALKARAVGTAAQGVATPAPAPAARPAEKPAAEGKPAAAGTAKPATPPAAPQPSPPPAFYQGLVDRLVEDEPVSEELLVQLAVRRGEAIVRELTAVGGVPAARVVLGDARKAVDAGDKAVTLQMELEAAK